MEGNRKRERKKRRGRERVKEAERRKIKESARDKKKKHFKAMHLPIRNTHRFSVAA